MSIIQQDIGLASWNCVRTDITLSMTSVIASIVKTIIFAINNNVPFVAFNYEHKISGLLEELHLKDEMIDIKDLFSSSDFN